MPPSIFEYLKTQRVGVLAVEMPDGSPHAATVHFAFAPEKSVFFFETNRGYRKSEALLNKAKSRASLVVGATEADMRTLQLDGEVRLLAEGERQLFEEVYFGKFPNKRKKANDSTAIFFTFVPTWWRFTDWTGPEGKKILTSAN